jgi:hypothetical protein
MSKDQGSLDRKRVEEMYIISRAMNLMMGLPFGETGLSSGVMMLIHY